MAGIAQLVERQIVALNVAGSSPVTRPNYKFKIKYHHFNYLLKK